MPGTVEIELLGGLRVHDGDRVVQEADWPARRAQELVALLALAEGRRLARDLVLDALWPTLGAQAAGANLRKAAHHARQVLGDPGAVVLRGGMVALWPGRAVRTDVDVFLAAAEAATDGATALALALGVVGELLPSSPYEAWAEGPRQAVRDRRAALLRRAGAWARLAELDPVDETAACAVMEAALADGRRHDAIRAYERLRSALRRELGARPGAAAQALYERCTAGVRLGERPLVGRASELAALAGARPATATTGAVVVRGSAGIGKSALLREAGDRASQDGWLVAATTAGGSGVPHAPLAALAAELAPPSTLPERTRAVLTRLGGEAGPGPVLTRHQVVAALRRALPEDRPVLLVVDDAHLADEATADVLHQLVTGPGPGTLLVVLAVRAEWLRTALPAGVAALAADARVGRLEVGPLTDDDIATLVAGAAPTAVDEVVRAAAGHPFLALELARGALAGRGLPASARDAIGARLVALPAADQDSLTLLAIGGDDLDVAAVLGLTGRPEPAAFGLLDAALDAGLLVVDAGRYRFAHDLVRRALTDAVAPHRRQALHREAAARLADAGALPERIAHHLLEGGRPSEAVPHLLAAARHAVSVGAFADARAEVDRLLAIDRGHAEGLVLRAEALDAQGDPGAPAAYAAAAQAVDEDDAHDLRARQALAQLKASDPHAALRTLEGVEPRTTVGRLAEALTLSAAAAIGVYADAATAAAKAEEAHALALELGDPAAVLDATWAHALAAHAQGELPARLREYLRRTSALPEIATRVFDGQLCVTERLLHGGLPNAEIIAFADGLAAEAERLGAARGHAFARTLRGSAALLAGRLDEAEADLADGARLHSGLGAAAGEALSLLGLAQVATARGRGALARPLLADALLTARESEVGHHTLDRVYGAMVEAAADPTAALAVVVEAEAAIKGPAETCPTCRIAFLVPATIAAARAGDLERADRYRDACDVAIDVIALPPAWSAAAEEARGWVARAHGDAAGARARFVAAAEGFAAWGQPLDAERCAALTG